MAPQPARRLFTVAEYHRMAQAGVLGEDDHVELIEGEIIQMSPIGPPHSGIVARLNSRFSREFGSSVLVWVQNPILLDDRSEPEPDVALLRPRADFYASAHPTPTDILLVIEVADTSVDYDRDVKSPLYARNAIPEYWLADVNQRHIVVYRDPTPSGYKSVQVVRPGETISALAFPDRRFDVAELLG